MSGKPRNLSDAIEELERRAPEAGEHLREEIERLTDLLKNLKPKIEEEARKAKVRVEDQIVHHPWTAVGVVGMVAFLLGVIFGWSGRRRD